MKTILEKIEKTKINIGDKVKYTCYYYGGESIEVDNIYVRDISYGNFPVVYLSNGHQAQWDGEKYVIHDLNNVVLTNDM